MKNDNRSKINIGLFASCDSHINAESKGRATKNIVRSVAIDLDGKVSR
ncbi:MAG: hypothetical protein J7K33_00080 [Candidatus Marinimicrobia bacterium]|nr:hypothetical protein [Candidatus Neomarinimicrobiota bacterium]